MPEMRALRSLSALAHALLSTWALGCGDVEHPPPAVIEPPDAGTAGGINLPPGDGGGPRAPDGSMACGGVRIPALVERPQLYFLIDASGSMGERIRARGPTKYSAARIAMAELLRAIGHRVRYGAAVFPGPSQTEACAPGRELFPLTDGDPLASHTTRDNGPVLQLLLDQLATRGPSGPTPTAASLRAVRALLEHEPGRRHVVLATDGAPNCNLATKSCPAGLCIPDIELSVLQSSPPLTCGIDVSCCSPDVVAESPATLCLDEPDTVAEVEALTAAGIPTYVIGMPGSEVYSSLLSALARAGGTARGGELAYYAVTDEGELTEALFAIGTGLAIGCEIALGTDPEDPGLVNLYFDGSLVPQSAADGWEWTSAGALTLRGESCRALEAGEVAAVEAVYGCRTVVR